VGEILQHFALNTERCVLLPFTDVTKIRPHSQGDLTTHDIEPIK